MKNIGFIGAGNMGEAYISSLFENNKIFFYEVNEARSKEIIEKYKVSRLKNLRDLIEKSSYVILSVKPQVMESILKEIKLEFKDDLNSVFEEKIFISIAAGLKIDKLSGWLKRDEQNLKIVRVMPNTPALIKKGISGVAFSNNISFEEKNSVVEILEATGVVKEIKEEQMDIVTAVSGSGPAYVMLMINSIADGAVKLGMTKSDALEFTIETFIGTAELLKRTGEHPEVLKDKVSSPGGTTAAGLYKMEENGIRKALIETVEATYKRSKELS